MLWNLKNLDEMQFFYDIKIDLHGFYPEDAVLELEELIAMNPGKSIMIVHGRGSGKVRNAVRAFLKKCNYVQQTELGENINIPGRDGITIAYVKNVF